eukprot:m.227833 g.227833  ORF g.227833 m.227833 type:complete len:53 (-) comp11649_c0_seq1:527-685(-)
MLVHGLEILACAGHRLPRSLPALLSIYSPDLHLSPPFIPCAIALCWLAGIEQ